jgi:type II secretory pathway component PulF
VDLLKGLNYQEKARFFYQLAALLKAGMSVQQSVMLAKNDFNGSCQRYLSRVAAAVGLGQDLATAMAVDNYFDRWTISLIKLAEYSGSLVETSQRLAAAFEAQQRRERLYRSVRLSVSTMIWSLLLVVAVIFNKNGNVLMQFSFWLNAIALALIFVGVNFWFQSSGQWAQPLVAQIPGLKKINEARSLLYLSELELPLSCGVSILTALELVRDRIPDLVIRSKLTTATKYVRAGRSISDSLEGKLPAIAIQMIRTGEETGNLDAAFQKLAEYYEGELERSLKVLQGILRPLSILAVGGLVAVLGIQMLNSLINSLPG